MDANEVVWNLKRLIRDGFSQGLPLSSLEAEYMKYFPCYKFPTPNSIQPGCQSWTEVFTASPKFLEWFKLDGRRRIKVLPKPEKDLKVYFGLVSYIQYIAYRQGAKVDNWSDLSESDSEEELDSLLGQALEAGLRRPNINLHAENEEMNEVESTTSSTTSQPSKRCKLGENLNPGSSPVQNCVQPSGKSNGLNLTSSQEIDAAHNPGSTSQIGTPAQVTFTLSSAAPVEKRSATSNDSCLVSHISVSHLSGSEAQSVHTSTARAPSCNRVTDGNEQTSLNGLPSGAVRPPESRFDIPQPHNCHNTQNYDHCRWPTLQLDGVKADLGSRFQHGFCLLCKTEIHGMLARLAHYQGNRHKKQVENWLHNKSLPVAASEKLTWTLLKRGDKYETWESIWLVVLNSAVRVFNLPEVVGRQNSSEAEVKFRLKLPEVQQNLENAYYTFSELLRDVLGLKRCLEKMDLHEGMPGYAEIRRLEDMFTREAALHVQEYKSTFVV